MTANTKFHRKKTFYERHVKRGLDVFLALLALLLFWWLFLVVAVLVRIRLGSPVLFCQQRPGFQEEIFQLYKFRTMTDERDEEGKLLPDEVRLTAFGKWLRSTSLDELPEIFNILKGDMSLVGPRPQLVRDMVFMSKIQRRRHLVQPGLTGLAQVNGRNAIRWEEKLDYDGKYIQKITFLGDLRILLLTVKSALIEREGIQQEDMATAEDFGDYLLRTGQVEKEKYDKLQKKALLILKEGHK